MGTLMMLSGRNPLPTELVDSTPVVARGRGRGAGGGAGVAAGPGVARGRGAQPGYPGCWVQLNPLVRGDRPLGEANKAQRSARMYSEEVLRGLRDLWAAGDVGGAGTEGAQAGPAPVPKPPLLQPRSHSLQLRQPPQGVGADPDLRARLPAWQHESITAVREADEEAFKRALARSKAGSSLTTHLSSNPLTAGLMALAAWCEGAWGGQACEWGGKARQWLHSPRP
jgi:hypothetical protein